MKKILIILSISALLASSATARYMPLHEDTGTDIAESSPHHSMTFY